MGIGKQDARRGCSQRTAGIVSGSRPWLRSLVTANRLGRAEPLDSEAQSTAELKALSVVEPASIGRKESIGEKGDENSPAAPATQEEAMPAPLPQSGLLRSEGEVETVSKAGVKTHSSLSCS